jgi:hypothetical protein
MSRSRSRALILLVVPLKMLLLHLRVLLLRAGAGAPAYVLPGRPGGRLFDAIGNYGEAAADAAAALLALWPGAPGRVAISSGRAADFGQILRRKAFRR